MVTVMDDLLKSLDDYLDLDCGMIISDNDDSNFEDVIKKSVPTYSYKPTRCLDGISRVYTED